MRLFPSPYTFNIEQVSLVQIPLPVFHSRTTGILHFLQYSPPLQEITDMLQYQI